MKPYPCPVASPRPILSLITAFVALLLAAVSPASAGTSTWTGGGDNDFWLNPANWNTPPAAGDSLIFTGTTRLANSNNIAVGTLFSSLTFNSPASGFTLLGNGITLGGNITNNQ